MKHPQSIQISIPNPCHEDWNKMTPQEQGRFCASCRKCVVDFTGFSDFDLLKFYSLHKGESICGQYKTEQLNRQIFVPKTRSAYYKWFISLGFIVFLSELLGVEAKAQQAVKTEASDTAKNSVHLRGDTLVNKEMEQAPVRNAADMVSATTMGLPAVGNGEALTIRGTPTTRTVYIIDGVQVKKQSFLRRTWYRLTYPFRKRD